jgi:hypothetical protein
MWRDVVAGMHYAAPQILRSEQRNNKRRVDGWNAVAASAIVSLGTVDLNSQMLV